MDGGRGGTGPFLTMNDGHNIGGKKSKWRERERPTGAGTNNCKKLRLSYLTSTRLLDLLTTPLTIVQQFGVPYISLFGRYKRDPLLGGVREMVLSPVQKLGACEPIMRIYG